MNATSQSRFRCGGAHRRFEWAVPKKDEMRCGEAWIANRNEELFEPAMS
jgi:hypothetical protein